MARIDAFFKLMNEQGASDLHLAAGQPPALRVRADRGRPAPPRAAGRARQLGQGLVGTSFPPQFIPPECR